MVPSSVMVLWKFGGLLTYSTPYHHLKTPHVRLFERVELYKRVGNNKMIPHHHTVLVKEIKIERRSVHIRRCDSGGFPPYERA